VNQDLMDDISSFAQNPLGFVYYAWEWGKDTLEDFDGPDEWQRDVLQRMGEKLQAGESHGAVIQEAVSSGHGVGKILSNFTYLDTPDGYRCWGDIEVGDRVFGSDGLPTKVTAKYPHKDWPFYKVGFSDGTNAYAGLEHQWQVTTNVDRKHINQKRVVTTDEMIGNLNRGYQIPLTSSVEYEPSQVPLDPYVIGYILGNGSMRTKGAVKISCYDEEVYEVIASKLPEGFSLNGSSKNYLHISQGKHTGGKTNKVVEALSDLGLHGKCGIDKFVPDKYKFNSSEVRIGILRGLMDSDGTISARKGDASRKGYKVQYSTSSVQLRDDIIWIVRSLGGVSNYSTDRRRGEKAINGRKMSANYDNYEVHINLPNNINPFSLSRKRVMYDDYVATVKREPIKIVRSIEFDHYWDGHCITVEAADHLYLTNDFIVTHNSALVAWIIEWGMATRVDTKGVVTANTENQLKTKTWAELAKWHRISVTEDWFTLTATALFSKDPMYEKTWRFDMIPWSEKNTEAFAGLHNKGKRVILIFDEASSIPDPIWEVSEGAMTDGNTELIWVAFGNPTKNTGRFKDCFGIYRHRWHTSKVDSRTASMTNKVKLQEWVDDYGEDSDFVRVRVRGEFPRAGNAQYISSEHVNNAVEREVDVAFGASKLMGVDVARFGEDRTVISRLHGRKLEEIHKFTGLDTMEVASKVAEFMNLYKPDAVFIDEIGIGAGVVDRLKQLGFDIIGVTSSNKADDERQYFNKRAEMWGRMKTWIAGADIPQDQDLIDDLIGPEYGYDSKMRIQLEKKSDMKKRGLASPDIGDSIALCFSYDTPPMATYDHEDLMPEWADDF